MKLLSALLASVIVALLGAEAATRWLEGYDLSSLPLRKEASGYGLYPGEVRYRYNLEYLRERGWDAGQIAEVESFDPVERFGEASAFPRYLFRPNFALRLESGRFVPTGLDDPERVWESNAQGYRGEALERADEAVGLRIVIAGGSVTEGQVALEGTLPFLLERALESEMPDTKVEVINAGFAGLGPPDVLALARYETSRLDPDIFVYFDAGNGLDSFHTYRIDRDTRGLPHWLDKHSALWKGLLRRFELPVAGFPYEVDRERENPKLESYLATLGELHDLLAARSIPMILVAPVVGYREGSWSDSHVPLDVYWLHEWWHPILPEDILAGHYRVTVEHMAGFAERRGIEFLDLQDSVGGNPDNFYRFGEVLDLGHFSADGNAAIARALSDRIAQRVAAGR